MSVCAILLSYKRQQNMDRILREIARVPDITRVILSNNNPEVDIHAWIKPQDYAVEVVSQPVPTLHTKRYDIALDIPDYDYFFCPDDDVFLTAEQISELITHLKNNPAVPHGMHGQIKAFFHQQLALTPDVISTDCEVEVLNRIFFFTRTHLLRMVELAQAMGYPGINEARFLDDVILSFSGDGLPLCHNIGEIAECPTSNAEGIASWREHDFFRIRHEGFLQLNAIVGEDVRRPLRAIRQL